MSSFWLPAQQISILRMQPVNYDLPKAYPVINQQLFSQAAIPREKKPGQVAQRSGMSLIILGPLKMAVGVAGVSICVADAVSGNASGALVVIAGVIGGFHLLSGAGLTAGGVILLRKAKRQREQNSTRVYLSMPDVKVNYTTTGGGNPGLGLHTALTF